MNDAAQSVPPVQTVDPLNDDQKISALNQAIDQAMLSSAPPPASGPTTSSPQLPPDPSVLDQALPMAVDQVVDAINPLNPATPRTTAKEVQQVASSEQPRVETGTSPVEAGNIQVVEQEPTPEISPEVEEYIQKVEDQQMGAPQEIVIADGTVGSGDTNYPSQPVVVLPYTKDDEEKGMKKSPKFSLRWLVEWGHKIVKIFMGKVIYRTEEPTS